MSCFPLLLHPHRVIAAQSNCVLLHVTDTYTRTTEVHQTLRIFHATDFSLSDSHSEIYQGSGTETTLSLTIM